METKVLNKLNDWQLYELYTSIELRPSDADGLKRWSRLYPKYVVITGRAFSAPHPHRHYTFEEFIDKLYSDPEFKKKLL